MSASCDRMLPFDRCAAAARIASRSPFGAPPRHSPGRTHPPLAQLQFPRFLRPDLAGVTRFDLSRVLPSSSQTGHHAGRAVAQSRPGAVCETAQQGDIDKCFSDAGRWAIVEFG